MSQVTKITFRLPDEMRVQAEGVMRRRGMLKISEFVRAALANELQQEQPPVEPARFARRRSRKQAA